MSQHDIYNRSQDAPWGYSTYSALLIPEYDWFESSGVEKAYKLLKRFKQFGDIIGKDHLAFWFHRSRFNYGRLVDVEVVAEIGAHISSFEELKAFLDKVARPDKPLTVTNYAYDVERARLICTGFSLDYAHGPYIVFFTMKPTLPYIQTVKEDEFHASRKEVGNRTHYTTPELVLKFGGLDIDRSLRVLDALEQQLLSTRYDPRQLRWKQVWLRVEQWAANNQDALIEVLRAVGSKVIPPMS